MDAFLSTLDLMIWPRSAYFVAALIALAGVVLALAGTVPGAKTWLKNLGANLFIGGTLVQIATGFWFLSTSPEGAQNPILGSPGDAAMFWGAVVAAFLALLIIHRFPVLAAVATLVTLVGLVGTWHREWVISLEPGFPADGLAIAPESAMFLSIAMLLSVAVALTGWTLWKLLAERRVAHPV